jgi:hypothetical protein
MVRIVLLLAGLLAASGARGQAPTAIYQVAVNAGPSWPLLSFAASNGGKGTARPGQYLTVAGTYQPGALGGCVALTVSRYQVDEAAALRQLDPAAPAPAALSVTAPWTTLSLLAGPQFVLSPAQRLRLAFRPLLVGAIVVGAPGYATGAGGGGGRPRAPPPPRPRPRGGAPPPPPPPHGRGMGLANGRSSALASALAHRLATRSHVRRCPAAPARIRRGRCPAAYQHPGPGRGSFHWPWRSVAQP